MTPAEQSYLNFDVPTYREIPLTKGQVALVDSADYDRLMECRWHATWRERLRRFYAASGARGYMHRVIMGLNKGDCLQVDHINHDTLDNRRSNLRICNNSQNGMNRLAQSNCKSGHRGVALCKSTGRWRVQIWVNGKPIWVGRFVELDDATRAYAEAAKIHHGEFTATKV